MKVKKVEDETVHGESIWELDLRSFDSASGPAVRLGYDSLGFTKDEAQSILSELMGRLGATDQPEETLQQPAAE